MSDFPTVNNLEFDDDIWYLRHKRASTWWDLITITHSYKYFFTCHSQQHLLMLTFFSTWTGLKMENIFTVQG